MIVSRPNHHKLKEYALKRISINGTYELVADRDLRKSLMLSTTLGLFWVSKIMVSLFMFPLMGLMRLFLPKKAYDWVLLELDDLIYLTCLNLMLCFLPWYAEATLIGVGFWIVNKSIKCPFGTKDNQVLNLFYNIVMSLCATEKRRDGKGMPFYFWVTQLG